MSRLWEKNETADSAIDEIVLKYTVGEDHRWDARLVPHDVAASIAHARMLSENGYLSSAEFEALQSTLGQLADEHAAGEWTISLQEEDVHTALETRLTERLGDLGGRIHLGRSRNDQVLAALRLYLKSEVAALSQGTQAVTSALEILVAKQGEVSIPGYTHLQRAMPSSVRDWAFAYARELEDDRAGICRALARIDINPLGSAAGYGVPVVRIDRERTTELLGFRETHAPVTAVQLSRGKAEATLLFELTLLMQDVGRFAADLCLFASQEFGFVALPHSFTTGSSIMPQKRNPDLFELMRARATQVSADLTAVLALTSKLTSGYHRDLQLLKPPLFRSIDSAKDTLTLLAHAIPAIEFQSAATEAALDPSLFATEEAYRLVENEGIPFREAYRRVGRSLQEPGKQT